MVCVWEGYQMCPSYQTQVAVVRSQFDEKIFKKCKWLLVRGMVLHVKLKKKPNGSCVKFCWHWTYMVLEKKIFFKVDYKMSKYGVKIKHFQIVFKTSGIYIRLNFAWEKVYLSVTFHMRKRSTCTCMTVVQHWKCKRKT